MSTTMFKNSNCALLLAIVLLYSSFGKAQDCPCPNTPMTEEEFHRDTLNYESLFYRYDKKKHTKWIYLPKNYFNFLDSFFNTTDYPGATFHFVSHKKIIDENQQGSVHQIMIQIEAGHGAGRNRDTLFKFHLNKVDLLWNPNYNQVVLSTSNKHSFSFIGPARIILPDANAIAGYKGSNPSNKYTKWVYICKAQINQVKQFLDANLIYKGVKLYFGSYNKPMDCVDLEDQRQFTLILVPVLDENARASIKEYLNFLKDLKEKFNTDYYNHGELCPNRCP